MGAKEATLKEVGEMLTHVVEHMAMKEDIADIRAEMATKQDIGRIDTQLEKIEVRLTSIESELGAIRRDLDDLAERFENVSGYRKEIDHALERIAAIEKHLGMEKRIAA
jgi:chromosome segregation ATPase